MKNVESIKNIKGMFNTKDSMVRKAIEGKDLWKLKDLEFSEYLKAKIK